MKFILGTKGKMTTVFTEDGRAYAATVINATPSVVTQIKTVEKEGYNAVQIGGVDKKVSHTNKAQLGHAKGKAFANFKEYTQRDGALPAGVEVGVQPAIINNAVPGWRITGELWFRL